MKKQFLQFDDAKQQTQAFGIKSYKEWKCYIKEGKLPIGMPMCPQSVYKSKWLGWREWFGTDFLSFADCRNIARNLNLREKRDWQPYVSALHDKKLPTNPNITYKNCGWKGWSDFLGTRTDMRKYSANEDFFKTWSPDMAYILGLWWADGCIEHTNWTFSISLKKSDGYLLHEILDKMESTYPVRTYSNQSGFWIRSHKIISDIEQLGGSERKSLTIGFPEVPTLYLCDFIRGFWDGDGCVSVNHLTKKYSTQIVSGSEKLITGIYSKLRDLIPNLGGSISHHKGNCIHLSFSKNDTIKLRNFIYYSPSKLMLIRKHDKFFSIGDMQFSQRKDMVSIEEFKIIVNKLKIKNGDQWRRYCKNNKKQLRVPVYPEKTFKNSGWTNWDQIANI